MGVSWRATSRRPNPAARPCARPPDLRRPRSPIQAPSDDKIRALYEPGSYEVVPHDNIRKIIARRLVEAKLTIPHFYLTLTCTIDKLMAAREDINIAAPKGADGKPTWKLSVNDFVIKAMAMALMKVPEANVTWTEGGMLKHKRADIGVAVAIPGGLITPVVRHAETKTLTAISNEMKDFAVRARARRLKPEEYQGGTTAISNLGMYGIHEFAAVINPPHATILAVGAGEETGGGARRQARDRDADDSDAVDGPSRRRRRARRRTARRLQNLHRKSGGDGDVRPVASTLSLPTVGGRDHEYR